MKWIFPVKVLLYLYVMQSKAPPPLLCTGKTENSTQINYFNVSPFTTAEISF